MKNYLYSYSTVHYSNDGYNGAPMQHTGVLHGKIFSDRVPALADNWDQVKDKKHINNLVIDADARRIIQAGGYSYNRGLFVDSY